MFKINLEEQLINSKQKTIENFKKKEQINNKLLQQVEHLLQEDYKQDVELLSSIGFDAAIENSQKLVAEKEQFKDLMKLNNSRIFSLGEIKSIAIKYYLRFLPIQVYKGSLPAELPQKIREFRELNLEVSKYNSFLDRDRYNLEEFYILAPRDSFELQEKPKDPLLFAKLENGSYYLIHKWGNDLNVFRYINTFLFYRSVTIRYISTSLIYFIPLIVANWLLFINWYMTIPLIAFIVAILCIITAFYNNECEPMNVYSKDVWNSKYK